MTYRDFFTGVGIAVSIFGLLALAYIACNAFLYWSTVDG